MITIEDKTYRNLEEQVQWLTDNILQDVDVVKNVVGKVPAAANLPSANLYNPGDTFAVGASQPFTYYTQIGGTWVNMGTFPLAGPAGSDGADGYNLYFSSASLTGSSTSVSISTFNNPESHTVNVGDFVIGGTDILLFIITSISAGTATILYKGQLKGPTGATGATGPAGSAGYAIYHSSEALTSSSTMAWTINITNPASLNYKVGDLIIAGSDSNLFEINDITYAVLGYVGITYITKLKGDAGMANPMTTAGDIIVGGASGTPTRLAMGTAGQFLCVNAAGTAVEWATVPDAGNQGV